MQPYLSKRNYNPKKANIDASGYFVANRWKIGNKISERFARNLLLLAQPQRFVLNQILRHVNSSEISIDNKFRFGYQDGYGRRLIGVSIGSGTYLHMTTEGIGKLTVSAAGEFDVSHGDQVGVTPDPSKIHHFN